MIERLADLAEGGAAAFAASAVAHDRAKSAARLHHRDGHRRVHRRAPAFQESEPCLGRARAAGCDDHSLHRGDFWSCGERRLGT